MSRLYTLQDLPELVTNLVELAINLLTEILMLLLQPSNLLFKAINPLIVGVGSQCEGFLTGTEASATTLPAT